MPGVDTPLLAGLNDGGQLRACGWRDQCFLSDGSRAKQASQKTMMRKILAAMVLCLFFMAAEVVGGYFAHSVAIMSDAAHMLSDVCAFAVSLFAAWAAARRSHHSYSFGYHRVEIIGALVSIMLIWLVTGMLVYEAVNRLVNPVPVDGKIMTIVAGAGIAFNCLVYLVLGVHGHLGHNCTGHEDSHGTAACDSNGACGHSHSQEQQQPGHSSSPPGPKAKHEHGSSGHDNHQAHSPPHEHSEGCSHHGHQHGSANQPSPAGQQHQQHSHPDESEQPGSHGHSHAAGHSAAMGSELVITVPLAPAAVLQQPDVSRALLAEEAQVAAAEARAGLAQHAGCSHGHSHSHGGHKHSHNSHNHGPAGRGHGHGGHRHGGHSHGHGSINMRGAAVHVLGDLVQSIGVTLAGGLIWYNQGDARWYVADPICTFLFSLLVLLTTRGIIADIMETLMERSPATVDIRTTRRAMHELEGVSDVHDLHVWTISAGIPILTAHVHIGEDVDADDVLRRLEAYVRTLGITHSTIQICNPASTGA